MNNNNAAFFAIGNAIEFLRATLVKNIAFKASVRIDPA